MLNKVKFETHKAKRILEAELVMNKYKELDIDQDFATELLENGSVVVVDVRASKELDRMAPITEDALNIDYYGEFKDELSKLDKDATYLVYCAAGVRSKGVVVYMKENGFDKAYNLLGGIKAWSRGL